MIFDPGIRIRAFLDEAEYRGGLMWGVDGELVMNEWTLSRPLTQSRQSSLNHPPNKQRSTLSFPCFQPVAPDSVNVGKRSSDLPLSASAPFEFPFGPPLEPSAPSLTSHYLMSSRAYQVLVWGATSFTGRLVVEHLLARAPSGLRWAVGAPPQLRPRLAPPSRLAFLFLIL